MSYRIRSLTIDDEAILWQMLMYAAQEPSLEAVQTQSCLTHYIEQWGRAGDMGAVAESSEKAIGAAWLRLWTGDDQGFGYVADAIPELAMAVIPTHRGQGIGTELLIQVLKAAQPVYPAVSLNVRSNNPALRLYERVGFTKVGGSEMRNRAGGTSFTMLYAFDRLGDNLHPPACSRVLDEHRKNL